jgi:hypothetical protein
MANWSSANFSCSGVMLAPLGVGVTIEHPGVPVQKPKGSPLPRDNPPPG